jgi:hypothetical protein
MVTIAQYTQHIQETVFPQAIHELQQCASPESVANWKKVVCRYIHDKSVAGEPAQEPVIPGVNP